MRRILFFLILLLLPVTTLAVTEGVVEEATPVELDMPEYPAQIEDTMTYYTERTERIIREHMGLKAQLWFRDIRALNMLGTLYDAQGVSIDMPLEEMEVIPALIVRFEYARENEEPEQYSGKAWAQFDQRTGYVLYAEVTVQTEMVYTEESGMLSDEKILSIAKDFLENSLGFTSYVFDGEPIRRNEHEVCPRIIAKNGDRIGLRMNGFTGQIMVIELYSLGEEA